VRRSLPLLVVFALGGAIGWLASSGPRPGRPAAPRQVERLEPGTRFRVAHSAPDGAHEFATLEIVRVVQFDGPDMGANGGNFGPREEWRFYFAGCVYYAVPVSR